MRKFLLSITIIAGAFTFQTTSFAEQQKIDDSIITIDLSSVKDHDINRITYWMGEKDPVVGSFEGQIISAYDNEVLYVTPRGLSEFPLVQKFTFEREDGKEKYTIDQKNYSVVVGKGAKIQMLNGSYVVPGDHQIPAEYGWLPVRWAFEREYNIQYIIEKKLLVMTKK